MHDGSHMAAIWQANTTLLLFGLEIAESERGRHLLCCWGQGLGMLHLDRTHIQV